MSSLKERWDLVNQEEYLEEFGEPENYTEHVIEELSSFAPFYAEFIRGSTVSAAVGSLAQSPGVFMASAGIYLGKGLEGRNDGFHTREIMQGYQEGLNTEPETILQKASMEAGKKSKEWENEIRNWFNQL